MSYQRGNPLSLTNGAAALNRGRFVRLVAGLVVTTSGVTDEDVIGVSADDTPANDIANIHMIDGMTIVEVEAGAAVVLGAEVAGDATGRAVTAATTGNFPAGLALQAAAGAGEFIKVLLRQKGNAAIT